MKYSIHHARDGETIIDSIDLDYDKVEELSSDSPEGFFSSDRLPALTEAGIPYGTPIYALVGTQHTHTLTQQEILERMGSEATEAEADVVLATLKRRGIETEEALRGLDDRLWSLIIQDAVQIAEGRA